MQPRTTVEKIFQLYEHDEILRSEYLNLVDQFGNHIGKLATLLAASGYQADSEMLWEWFNQHGQMAFPG